MICSVCKLDKPEIEFYLSNQNTCKVCCKLRWAKRRSDNIELVRAYDRNRPNKKERQQKQKEYKERMRKENPEKYDRIFHGLRKRYSARHKEKIRAEGLVNDAIRYGKLKRPNRCESCGKDCNPQAHHYDYSKPFEVVWLCTTCHANVHKEMRERARKKRMNLDIPF